MHLHPVSRLALLAATASLAFAAESPRPSVTVAALLEKAKAITTTDARDLEITAQALEEVFLDLTGDSPEGNA